MRIIASKCLISGHSGLKSVQFEQAIVAKFGSVNNAKVDAAFGEYAVKALNLTDAGGGLHQDFLVVVPEPGTYLAGLSALGMLGLFGWRNRK